MVQELKAQVWVFPKGIVELSVPFSPLCSGKGLYCV